MRALDDFSWSYALPGRCKPPPGDCEVRVRGLDIVGNATAAVSAAARTLVSFRMAR